LCDNALLNGFAASEPIISRAIVEEIATTFDMVPHNGRRAQHEDEQEAPARVFRAAGRAELWAAGDGNGSADNLSADRQLPIGEFRLVSEPDVVFNEHALQESPTTIEELGSAFNASGLGKGNNGQNL